MSYCKYHSCKFSCIKKQGLFFTFAGVNVCEHKLCLFFVCFYFLDREIHVHTISDIKHYFCHEIKRYAKLSLRLFNLNPQVFHIVLNKLNITHINRKRLDKSSWNRMWAILKKKKDQCQTLRRIILFIKVV